MASNSQSPFSRRSDITFSFGPSAAFSLFRYGDHFKKHGDRPEQATREHDAEANPSYVHCSLPCLGKMGLARFLPAERELTHTFALPSWA